MPLYFAYGSNMDADGLRARCPASRVLGRADLAGHRFHLMAGSGYASVVPEPGSTVHGLLIDLTAGDVAALDDYEDVASGLYRKAERDVDTADGVRRALVYLGTDGEGGGRPPPGYMECVVAAARAAGLPPRYVATLAAHLEAPTEGETRW